MDYRSFYEILDEMIEANDHWLAARSKEALSHKEFFTELSILTGDDAISVILGIFWIIDAKLQWDGAPKPSAKKDRRENINNGIQKFKGILHKLYGKFDDDRVPPEAVELYGMVVMLENRISTKGTYENKMLYGRRPKNLVTKEHLIDLYKEVEEKHNIQIPIYRATQLWEKL